MFVGHLAAGFALKARVREAPLGPLLAGTAFLDFLFGVFVMIGLERVVVHDPPVFRNWELHIGYSHSLLVSVLYSVALGWLAGRVWRSTSVGVALGLAVFSHFVLDVVSHRADMPLVGLGMNHDVLLGTGLATHPLAFFLVELGWCLLAWRWYDGGNHRLLLMFLVLMAIWANNVFGFVPQPALSSSGQAAFTIFGFVIAGALLWWAARPTEERALRTSP
ncbi:MAG: hypothetical protein HY271_06745 [Deltaproteobacteria bacterium]|nr:hypothetical protein [Deltaproteobacteria bacterium]